MRRATNFARTLLKPAALIFDHLSPYGRLFDMKSHHYDIVRQEQEDDNSAIWLEAVSDLNAAESRIQELVSFWPGEFQILDQQNHRIVARASGLLHRHTPLVEPQRVR
jgi:hypothetical protein